MVGWHHGLSGREFEQTLGDGEGREPGVLQSSLLFSHSVVSDSATPWTAAMK